MRLKDKVSLITGAAQGIGLATALKFAREGAIVIVCDMKAAAVDEAVAECRRLGAQSAGFVVNVTDRAQVDAMVAAVKLQFGRIDVLVNNAGITHDARLQKMTLAQFDAVIDVNLRGVFHCAQAVVDTMVDQRGGVILNASSVVGIYGNFGQTKEGLFIRPEGNALMPRKAAGKAHTAAGLDTRRGCATPHAAFPGINPPGRLAKSGHSSLHR